MSETDETGPVSEGQTAWQAAAAAGVTPDTPQHEVTGPASDAELGAQVAAGGASATEVDPAALLAAIKQLQSQVTAMEAEKRQANAPEVVGYAQALGDHLQAKADANPVIHADPDYTYPTALEKARVLGEEAGKVAESGGDTGHVVRLADEIVEWVADHADHFPGLDYSYIRQLGKDVKSAAAKLAA